jgi:hypothetical protein
VSRCCPERLSAYPLSKTAGGRRAPSREVDLPAAGTSSVGIDRNDSRRPGWSPLALRFPANPILKEEHVEQASTVKAEGLGSVLQGCASCCDGVLQQVRDAGLDQDIIRRLEQARDLCRSLGEELPG